MTEKTNPEKFHYKVRNIANSLSAIYGYEFGNEKWLKIYKLFNWYKPKTKVPDFELSVKVLIEKLISNDNSRK